MMGSLNIRNYNNFQFYFTAIAIIICLYFVFALLFDFFQIHIYRHDAAYYRSMDQYFYNLKTEGRWVNYLLYPVLSAVPGRIATFVGLLFFFLFTLFVCTRLTNSISYSFLVAALIIQVEPLMMQIMWPALILPAFFLLFISVLVSSYIPVYLFYLLFGVLFFGAMSHFYYLLPLVHLSLLTSSSSWRQNFKVLFFKILPAWALGFVAGYLFLLLIVYILSGQFGIKVADWRQTNYIDSFQDLKVNILQSFSYMRDHIALLFSDIWRKVAMIFALLIGLAGVKKVQYMPIVVVSIAIVVAHYVVIIPIGLGVQFRTAIVAWIGILVLLFFYPSIKRWQYYFSVPIILFITFSLYKVNHESLKWYAAITNAYYSELLRVTPRAPELYDGVIFLSSTDEVVKMNSILGKQLDVTRQRMETLDHEFRWAPVGYEAGFKEVLFCDSVRHKNHKVCKDITINVNTITSDHGLLGMYSILGHQKGYLIVSLNDKYIL